MYNFAKEYYIGDIIKFNIESDKEEKEITEAFKDFEIEKIEKKETGFIITARAYSVGKKRVEIDKNSFEMEIKSSITKNTGDISKENSDINKNYGDEKNSKINMQNEKIEAFPYTVIILLTSLAGILFLLFFIIKIILKNSKNYYKKLEKELKNAEKGDYFKESVISLKNYIEKRTGIKTTDKTSSESELELKKTFFSENDILLIKDIMESADKYKFMKNNFNEKEKQEHIKKILNLGKIVEEKFKKIRKGDVK